LKAAKLHTNFLYSALAIVLIFFIAIAVYTQLYYVVVIPFALLLFLTGWHYPFTIFLFLIASLAFSTEYQVTSSLGTDFPDELLMLLVALLAVFFLLASKAINYKTWIGHPLLYLLAFVTVWSVISAVFSTQPLLSVKFLLAKGWYLGAFVLAPILFFKTKKNIQLAAAILAVSMLLITTIIMIRHSYYHFSFADINKALQPFFRNHVNYSAMLVCVLPIVWSMRQQINSKWIKRILAAGLLLLAGALIFSYARGAWLALLTGIIAAVLIRRRKVVLAYVIVIATVISVLFWLKHNDRYLQYAHDYRSTVFHEKFKDHLVATYQLKDVSTAERFYRWIAGVRMIKENTLTGFGPNSFYNSYKPYTVPAFKTWVSNNPEHSTVHNYFLLLTVEQGIPALLFFLLLTLGMFYYAQLIYHRTTDFFYKQLALVVGVMLTMILTVNSLSDLVETDKIGSLFFLCIAALVSADIGTKKDKNNEVL
jgi:O-antigen ligase